MLLNRILRWAVLTLVATNTTALQAESEIDERVIYGWVEWVQVEPSMIPAKAKLDTGAKTSSLHAKNIEWFEKDGKDWVRFHFSPNTKLSGKRMLEGKTKNFVTIEAPVYRSTLIKQHKRPSAERPVILHKFMLDGHEYEAQFTLTDRSRFIYPVLLGRRFLEHAALVDPSRTYLRTSPPSKNKDKGNDSDVAKKTRSDNGKKAEQAIQETKADNNNAADKSDIQ
jgi:hypothetical protein